MPWVRDEPRRQDMTPRQPGIPGQRISPPGGYGAAVVTSPAQVGAKDAQDYARHLQAYQERYEAEKAARRRGQTAGGAVYSAVAGAGEEFGRRSESVARQVIDYGEKAGSKAVDVLESAAGAAKEAGAAASKAAKAVAGAGGEAADALKSVSSAAQSAGGAVSDVFSDRVEQALKDIAAIGGSIQNKIDNAARILDSVPDRVRDEILKQLEKEGALWEKIAKVLKGALLPHQITDSRAPAAPPQYVTVLGGWDPWMQRGGRQEYGVPRWGQGDRVRGVTEGWAGVQSRAGLGRGSVRLGTGNRNLASLWGN